MVPQEISDKVSELDEKIDYLKSQDDDLKKKVESVRKNLREENGDTANLKQQEGEIVKDMLKVRGEMREFGMERRKLTAPYQKDWSVYGGKAGMTDPYAPEPGYGPSW